MLAPCTAVSGNQLSSPRQSHSSGVEPHLQQPLHKLYWVLLPLGVHH